MLTKNLLRSKSRKGRVTPQFVKVDDAELLALAEQLIAIFRESLGKTQESLSEQTAEVIEASGLDVLIGRGFEKLLIDRSEFLAIEKDSLVELRDKVFLRTSQLLFAGDCKDFEDANARIAHEFGFLNAENLQAQLYADLPLYSTVASFKELSPEALLHRYNAALVQGLLLRCSSLKLRVSDGKLTSLRPLFKYLRFFQLLVEVKKIKDQQFELAVDGPLSLFYQTQKYGLNLANFFPAVLHLKTWELEAEIQDRVGGKVEVLKIDNSCGIRSHYQNFSDYIPREVEMFKGLFEERVREWTIGYADDYLALGGEHFCFPDFVLTKTKPTNETVALEIFHPWHERALLDRLVQLDWLAQLEHKPAQPLILGVAKKLLAKPEIAAAVQDSKWFQNKGFVFREMPTPEQVMGVLKSVP